MASILCAEHPSPAHHSKADVLNRPAEYRRTLKLTTPRYEMRWPTFARLDVRKYGAFRLPTKYNIIEN